MKFLVIAGLMKRLQLLKWKLQEDVEDQEHHARDFNISRFKLLLTRL